MSNIASHNLDGEAKAFDTQIIERVSNGHIPDLRCNKKTEWFYNNVWRDPELIKISFLENIRYFLQHINKKSKVLEVGCGPGYNSLELARHGHSVIGVDLSPECIDVAQKTLAQNVYHDGFGSLNYYSGDFLSVDIKEGPFDVAMCYGTLSHFLELDVVLDRVMSLLKSSGRILVWDTNVDLYTKTDASILYLIRSLLSFTGHYYKNENLPEDEDSLMNDIEKVFKELMYVDDTGTNVQSPNDNCNSFDKIMCCLDARFKRIAFEPEACFYRNMIGGLRFDQNKDLRSVAILIKMVESFLIKQKVLSPAFYYYIGEKR